MHKQIKMKSSGRLEVLILVRLFKFRNLCKNTSKCQWMIILVFRTSLNINMVKHMQNGQINLA